MKIAIGSDHGGLDYKTRIISHLKNKNIEVIDVGTFKQESCHYPIYAFKVGELVSDHEADFGVVICTSGEGVCIAANKVKGIRCGIAYNDEVAKLMRQHNDANVIAFSQAFMDFNDVINRLDLFLKTPFEGGRHQLRVQLISDFEKNI